MRQAVMTEPGVIEFGEVPVPSAGADEILLRIKRIGICGSDMHVYHGVQPFTKYPVVQGHEFSAVVEAVGAEVAGIRPGAKVTARPQVACGECRPCRRGDYHICDRLRVQGFQAPGCAQDLFVTKAEKVVCLPDNFTFEQGAFVEPVAVAVRAVARAGDLHGTNVVVFGAGPIGNLVGQVARAHGAKVLITDLSEFRLDIASRCGLEHTSNTRTESVGAASRRVFGEAGFDAAIECVGIEATVDAAIEHIAKGGRIVAVGNFPEKPRVNVSLIQDRELSLIGTLMYKHEDYRRAVELIAAGDVVTDPLETKHFSFEDYLAAYHYIVAQRGECMKVFIDL